MVLLSVDANELSFPVVNVVAICIGVFSMAGAWFKMQYDKRKLQDQIDRLITDQENGEIFCRTGVAKMEEKFNQEIVSLRNSKRNLKKDLAEQMKNKEEIIMKRIDKLQQEAKEDRLANNKEFKIISGKLETIAGGIGELKGMIQKNN